MARKRYGATTDAWRVMAALVLPAVLVLACGPADTPLPGNDPAPASTAVADEPAAAASEPRATGEGEPLVSTYIMWQGFFDLDPAYAFASESVALDLCYENLVYYNPPGSEEEFSPGLATAWQANDDGTEWTFTLRQGVTFQDGTPFDAETVKFSIERYLEQEGLGCSMIWQAVERVEVVDDDTVTLHLSYPAAIDLIATSAYCAGMVSPSVAERPREWFDEGHCVGTGPYTITSHEPGQRLVMDRFDGYWQGWQEDQFDTIVFQIITDPVVASQLMETGESDFWRNAQPDRIDSLAAMEGLEVYVQPAFQDMMFMLNTRKPPLDDPVVRQALAYSYPYDDYVQRTRGIHKQAQGAIPAGMWGHGEELYQYQYDLEKARALLAEAGYAQGGFELEMTYPTDLPIAAWAVELWSFSLQDLGIELKPRPVTGDALLALAQSGPSEAQDLALIVWWPTWVTPYDWLANLYTCQEETFFNFTYWCSEEYDALVTEGDLLSATDRAAAEGKFVEAQRILLEENPAMFMFDLSSVWVVSSDIEGFVDNPAYQNVVFYHDLTVSR